MSDEENDPNMTKIMPRQKGRGGKLLKTVLLSGAVLAPLTGLSQLDKNASLTENASAAATSMPGSVGATAEATSFMMAAAGNGSSDAQGGGQGNMVGNLMEQGTSLFSSLSGSDAKQAHFQIRDYINNKTTGDTNVQFDQTVSAMFGQPLYSYQGREIGQVEDVLVNRETGATEMVVFTKNGEEPYFWESVDEVSFTTPDEQQTGVDVTDSNAVQAEDHGAGAYDAFTYDRPDMSDYVSLRRLDNGEVRDMDNNYVGEIDAIIHREGDTRNLIFTLQPDVGNSEGEPLPFYLPFDQANFVENEETADLDIVLNEVQTRAVAELFFAKESQETQG